MRSTLRENALFASAAAACCAALMWLGLYSFAWNDYEVEARPAFDALVRGHLAEFLRLAPAYGGSLIERAPFALVPGLWGGSALAVYRMVALPCLLATAVLAVWLAARARAASGSMLAAAIAIGVCTASPLALSALEQGHPEELLGAALCVAAVLVAARPPVGRRRAIWAGVLLGLAVANKEWAVLAVGPVLLALPRGRRLQGLVSAAVTATAILAPLALATSGRGAVGGSTAGTLASGGIFQPWQVWWFLGHHGPLLHSLFGIPLHGYRAGPAWTGLVSHPLIVLVGFGSAGALWLQRKREGRPIDRRDTLLLLALALLLRCILDTWDTGYYMLPFLIALFAWELDGVASRTPILALVVVVVPWWALHKLSAGGVSPDVQSAIFLIWTVPLSVALGLVLYAPRLVRRRLARLAGTGSATSAQEITVSPLGRPLSSS